MLTFPKQTRVMSTNAGLEAPVWDRSYGDVRNNKTIYDKLTKHFDKYRFPQPILACQAEVGKIKEWRFIAGDAPSRTVEVEKADKSIGESFGRVLHWLICSADRLRLARLL